MTQGVTVWGMCMEDFGVIWIKC